MFVRDNKAHASGQSDVMPGRSAMRRLSRQDLLELLIAAVEENDRLAAENARLAAEVSQLRGGDAE
jgi:cell division protein FtsB